MKIAFSIIYLAIGSLVIVLAQERRAIDTLTPFGAVFFENRIPASFNMFKNRHHQYIEQTAKIPSGDTDIIAELFWTIDSVKNNNFAMVVQYSTGTFSTSPITFACVDSDQLTVTTSVRMSSSESDPPSTLELRLLIHNRILLFKWLGSKSTYSQAGGVPVKNTSALSVGKHIPDFSVNSLTHKTLQIKNTKGRFVVINWWSTGCLPCREEIPGLNKLVDRFKSKNIEFIAIAWNNESEVERFLKGTRFKYDHYVHNETVNTLFGNTFPRNIIVNSKGLVVYDHTGGSSDTYLDLQKAIEKEFLTKK
jgi:thiol-disulfide isomerase/thioredoxin